MSALKIWYVFHLQKYANKVLPLPQQKNYTAVWDKIKAKSYNIPHDSHALQHAKAQKIILSNVSFESHSVDAAVTILCFSLNVHGHTNPLPL